MERAGDIEGDVKAISKSSPLANSEVMMLGDCVGSRRIECNSSCGPTKANFTELLNQKRASRVATNF